MERLNPLLPWGRNHTMSLPAPKTHPPGSNGSEAPDAQKRGNTKGTKKRGNTKGTKMRKAHQVFETDFVSFVLAW